MAGHKSSFSIVLFLRSKLLLLHNIAAQQCGERRDETIVFFHAYRRPVDEFEISLHDCRINATCNNMRASYRITSKVRFIQDECNTCIA